MRQYGEEKRGEVSNTFVYMTKRRGRRRGRREEDRAWRERVQKREEETG